MNLTEHFLISSLFNAASVGAEGVVQQEGKEIEQSPAAAEEKALFDSEIKVVSHYFQNAPVTITQPCCLFIY